MVGAGRRRAACGGAAGHARDGGGRRRWRAMQARRDKPRKPKGEERKRRMDDDVRHWRYACQRLIGPNWSPGANGGAALGSCRRGMRSLKRGQIQAAAGDQGAAAPPYDGSADRLARRGAEREGPPRSRRRRRSAVRRGCPACRRSRRCRCRRRRASSRCPRVKPLVRRNHDRSGDGLGRARRKRERGRGPEPSRGPAVDERQDASPSDDDDRTASERRERTAGGGDERARDQPPPDYNPPAVVRTKTVPPVAESVRPGQPLAPGDLTKPRPLRKKPIPRED